MKRKRRWWLAGILLAGILIVLLINRGPSLDKWKKEMQSRGERFTVAELVPAPPEQPDECQPVIDKAAGWLRLAITSQSPPNARTELTYPRWNAEHFHSVDGRIQDWATAREDLRRAGDILSALHEALSNPVTNPGWDYLQASAPPGYAVRKRLVGQFLANATIISLHESNVQDALRNLESLLGLIRHHADDRFFVSQMIRVALTALAAEITSEALKVPGWTEAQLHTLQNAWSGIDLFPALTRSIEMERAIGSAYFAGIRTGKYPLFPAFGTKAAWQTLCEDNLVAPVYKHLWLNSDEWFYLRSMQAHLDLVRNLQQHRSWQTERPTATAETERAAAAATGVTRYRYAGSSQLLVQMQRATETAVRAQTLQQLALAAIAIHRYQLQHGAPPPSLTNLVPHFLAELPVDYADAQPVRYRLDRSLVTLYACGPDLKDDNGNPRTDVVWNAVPWP